MTRAAPAGSPQRMGRDTVTIAALTAMSRVTGFARIVVVAAVLGTGLLGDVYQSANTVPNLLFELLAGGALQAALVPLFVASRRESGEQGLASATGAVAGTVTVILAGLAAVTAAAAPLIARGLTAAEPDPGVAADKVRVASWMLIVFAPQVVFYGLGLVASAALQARGRFVAAAVAPAVNNVVVIGAYLAFHALRAGASPSLDLDSVELLVLAGGTTLAVVAFTSVPVVALVRSTHHPIRLRASLSDPAVRRVRAVGGWAVLQVAGTLALTAGALVIGNGAEGGVAVFSLGLAVFLLPYALIAAPVATAALPRLAALHQADDEEGFAELVRASVRRVVLLSGAASLGLALCAWPIARLIVFGAADERGPAPVAHVLLAFAPGVVPYGAFLLLSRVLISRGQVRRAALVSLVTAGVGLVAMGVLSAALDDSERAAALALAYAAAHLVGSVVLLPVAAPRRHRASETSGPTARGLVLQLLGPSSGGIRRHVAALTTDLRDAGHDVEVAGPTGVLSGLVGSSHVVAVPDGLSLRGLRRARGQLGDLLNRLGPVDVVHAHGLKAGWIAVGVVPDRTVLTVHNVVLEGGPRGALLRVLERRVVRRVAAAVATSPEIARRFASVASLAVIEPVHDVRAPTEEPAQVRRSLGARGPLVVTVGRLHPQKDLLTFVRAAHLLTADLPDLLAVVAGEGPQRKELTALISELGAAGQVRLLGEREDVAALLRAADVVVISSAWESGPLTLLEAGAVGAAVVSTPVGFVPEVVRDGVSGLLVPIGDPPALARAIMSLVTDPDRAHSLGSALCAAVEPRLDRVPARRSIEAVYDRVRRSVSGR